MSAVRSTTRISFRTSFPTAKRQRSSTTTARWSFRLQHHSEEGAALPAARPAAGAEHGLPVEQPGQPLPGQRPTGAPARIAVTRALALDSASMLSYDTAAKVYAQLGEHRLASYFRDRRAVLPRAEPLLPLPAGAGGLARTGPAARLRRGAPGDRAVSQGRALLLPDGDGAGPDGETRLADDSREVATQLTPDTGQQEAVSQQVCAVGEAGLSGALVSDSASNPVQ